MLRRDFLKTLSDLFAFSVWTSSRGFQQPDHVNVKTFGAVGDGATDDTEAFNRCIRSVIKSPAVVLVPSGRYRIDATKSVRLQDNLVLQFDEGAVLEAIPTRSNAYAILVGRDVQNISVTGGSLIGDRRTHPTATGEWGMGVDLRGCSDVRVENVKITDCWGDGFYVGRSARDESKGVTIRGCSSQNNRRQGISLTACSSVLIENCTISGTGGTAPQSGIDLEPNRESRVSGVTIRQCTIVKNAGWGIAMGANVDAVNVVGSTVVGNAREGISIAQSTNCTITSTVIEMNGKHGISIQAGRSITVRQSQVCANGVASPDHYQNITIEKGSTQSVIKDCSFDCELSAIDAPRWDVRVMSPDCLETQISNNRFRHRDGGRGGVENHGTRTIITS